MLRGSMINHLLSVLGTFVDNTIRPLRYHCDDSVVVFRYNQHTHLMTLKHIHCEAAVFVEPQC